MGAFAIILGISFFILALVNGYTIIESMVFLISIIVANVPEGLLPQMTVALTLTAQRMLKLGVLVQNLEIIETLGAVTVICSDKTGTLTQNLMSASHVVYNNKIHIIKDQTPIMDGDTFEEFNKEDPQFKKLLNILILNTDAVFLDKDPNIKKREVKGDASEAAIIKFSEVVTPIEAYREKNQRKFALPFNSSKKWMLAIHEIPGK
jgi:sodium/potassium-transporting ATPase subunit alpha